MHAPRDEGLRIPHDVARVGADDLLLGRLPRSRLSTVHVELPSGRDPGNEPEGHRIPGASAVRRDST